MNLLPENCHGHARVSTLTDLPDVGRAVTIGNYDGLHLGHQSVLRHLTEIAQSQKLESVVLTFEPTPLEFFRGEYAPPRLSTLADKAALIDELCPQLDRLIILPFNIDLADTSAASFVDDILIRDLNTRYVTVGENFHFGRNREGNVAFLQSAIEAHGSQFEPTPTFRQNNARVSSTRVREALASGDVSGAEELLGHPYVISAIVIVGDQRGREWGFPTANLEFPHTPAMRGVFAVRVDVDGQEHLAVANVGRRPTIDGKHMMIEVHLLDFDQDLYGKRIATRFCQRLRAEEKFESPQQLREQIARDVAAAREYFSNAV